MFAKIENGRLKVAGGKVLKYDDKVITNPREEDFVKAGYKPFVGNPLKEKEGYYQVAEYTEEDDKIVANYHYEVMPDEEVIA